MYTCTQYMPTRRGVAALRYTASSANNIGYKSFVQVLGKGINIIKRRPSASGIPPFGAAQSLYRSGSNVYTLESYFSLTIFYSTLYTRSGMGGGNRHGNRFVFNIYNQSWKSALEIFLFSRRFGLVVSVVRRKRTHKAMKLLSIEHIVKPLQKNPLGNSFMAPVKRRKYHFNMQNG